MPDEYSIPCASCGAGCRPIDRFCSQCGRRDPTGRLEAEARANDDALLFSPTLVISEAPAIEEFPQLAPTLFSINPMGSDAQEVIEPTHVFPIEEITERESIATSPTPHTRRISSAERRAKEVARIAQLERMLVPGNVFARRYRIQKFLGAGGMGHVCSAIDDSIDEMVALKILSAPLAEDPAAFERFKNELRLARRIRHRNVVQSFDLGFGDGYPYISMEYIDADNLQKHLAKRPYEETKAIGLFRQILRGLRAAHELGIIHRDMKPENILVNKDGVAFITDFGIATTADRVRRTELAGTPDYMSPEQLRCEDVTPSSDLYSCGVMLYRMLSGKLPFQVDSVHKMIEAQLHETPQPLPDELDLSPVIRDLIDWLLQKQPADRPQNAQEVLAKLDEAVKRQKTLVLAENMSVLVADRDPEMLTSFRSALEAEGFKVTTAATAREAVNVAFENHPSVMLIDAAIGGGHFPLRATDDTTPGTVPLHGADALDFCRIVRGDEKLRRVPIVVMSEPSEAGLKNLFSQCGASDFLVKPLAPAEISSAIRRVRAPEA